MSLPRKLGKSSIERDANRLKTFNTGSVENPLITGDIQPKATDTHDIGTSTLLYRKLYASEIDALIFAQQTISLIGGWLFICKGEGAVDEDVNTTETEIEFGSGASIVQDDILLFRAAGKVEYMSADNNVAGDLWDVTRNLDGSGANDWPKGTPYANLGLNGDGRIELNAFDSPRMSMIRQGAAYNDQDELLRVGDLDGNWGYVAETYGLAIGEYGAGIPNITIDAVNSAVGGIRIRSHTTILFHVDMSGNVTVGEVGASKSNVYISSGALQLRTNTTVHIDLEADGDIFIGEDVSAPATTNIAIFTNAQNYNGEAMGAGDFLIGDNTASKANIYWDKSDGELEFRGGQTMKVKIGTDGALLAGAGVVTLDADGITIDAGQTNTYQIKWKDGATQVAGIYGDLVTDDHRLFMTTGVATSAGNHGWIHLLAYGASAGLNSSIDIISGYTGNDGSILFYPDGGLSMDLNPGYGRFREDLRIYGGLYVGSNTDPPADTITADDYIVALGGLHVGGTSDPTTDDLLVDGETRLAAGLYVGSDSAPDADDIHYDGNLKSEKTATHDVYAFHPLSTPLTHTSFDGDSFSDVGASTKIENSSWSSTIPTEAVALLISIIANDSGSAGGACWFSVGPTSGFWYAAAARPEGLANDYLDEETTPIPCTNGDIYYRCEATGTNTLDVVLRVSGYWI